jgi:hypothetical protein
MEYQVSEWNPENINREWVELLSCLFASIFIGKKTGLQIRNGRTNIIKRKLKSQIGEVSEKQYLVNLNDFKSPGLDELHPKPAERNCRCNLRDTIGNLQEIVGTIRSAGRQKKDNCFPDF